MRTKPFPFSIQPKTKFLCLFHSNFQIVINIHLRNKKVVDEKEIHQLNNKRAKTCKHRMKTMKFENCRKQNAIHPFLFLYFSLCFAHSSRVGSFLLFAFSLTHLVAGNYESFKTKHHTRLMYVFLWLFHFIQWIIIIISFRPLLYEYIFLIRCDTSNELFVLNAPESLDER